MSQSLWALWAVTGVILMGLWQRMWTQAIGLPSERKWHRLTITGLVFTFAGLAATGFLIGRLT
jgi:uncharacterized protein involved in response to NO